MREAAAPARGPLRRRISAPDPRSSQSSVPCAHTRTFHGFPSPSLLASTSSTSASSGSAKAFLSATSQSTLSCPLTSFLTSVLSVGKPLDKRPSLLTISKILATACREPQRRFWPFHL